MHIISLLTLTIKLTLCLGQFDQLLQSPAVTNWGNWTSWSYCSPNEFVVGMQLKVDEDEEDDGTALNGIRLLCAPVG